VKGEKKEEKKPPVNNNHPIKSWLLDCDLAK